MKVIAFTKVSQPYGWLGNMAPFPITYADVHHRTSEALFQCLRFADYPNVQAAIREQRSPMAAKMIARKHRHLLNRSAWDESEDDIPRMRLCLALKLDQHPSLEPQLLATDDSLLIEDCTKRPHGSSLFWGALYKDGVWVGRNVLGTLWMELRDEWSVRHGID